MKQGTDQQDFSVTGEGARMELDPVKLRQEIDRQKAKVDGLRKQRDEERDLKEIAQHEHHALLKQKGYFEGRVKELSEERNRLKAEVEKLAPFPGKFREAERQNEAWKSKGQAQMQQRIKKYRAENSELRKQNKKLKERIKYSKRG